MTTVMIVKQIIKSETHTLKWVSTNISYFFKMYTFWRLSNRNYFKIYNEYKTVKEILSHWSTNQNYYGNSPFPLHKWSSADPPLKK